MPHRRCPRADSTRFTCSGYLVMVVLAVMLTAGCASTQNDEAPYREVTIEDIVRSLPLRPVPVGFDVDDTLLFSTPGFHYALTNRDGPGGSNRYGSEPLSSTAFWQDMNNRHDGFSLPKESGRALLKMHLSRGDDIYFITARTGSQPERLTELLGYTFGIPEPNPVIFVGHTGKTRDLRRLGIVVYYGDADSDVEDARKAGVRAIRLLRSPLSNNPSDARPGHFGEEVLENSAY